MTGLLARPSLKDAALLTLVVLVAGLNGSRFVGYVCDDAVISFRSVQNFGLGHGFVYNIGERLETFTNLGLVWLLAAARALGFGMFEAAGAIGCAAACGTIVAVWWLARELGIGRIAWAPALLAASSTTLMGQSGSGLETTVCALLMCLGTARVLTECRPRSDGRPRRHGIGMALLSGAVLARPDSVLVLGGLLVLKPLLLDAAERRRALAKDALVGATLVAAQVLFRLAYYGSVIPNPVRTKVGLAPDPAVYKQGVHYLLEWLRTDFGIAVLVAGLGLALCAGRAARMLVVVCAGWCLFVIVSGGDHMPYSRFFAPVLSLFAVTIAAGWHTLFAGGGRLRAMAGVAFALTIAAQPVLLSVTRGNIPARNWPLETYRREIGEFFAREAGARGGRLVVAGSAVGYIGYFGGDGVRIVDMLGLCDQHIAHHGHRDTQLPPGHQLGDGAYVLAQRPDFILLGSTTPGDLWQRRDAIELLQEIRSQGAVTWAAANDHRFMVSERELLASDALYRDYEFRTETLPSGRTLHILQRGP